MNQIRKYTWTLFLCIMIFIILIVKITRTTKDIKSIEILNKKNKFFLENSKKDSKAFGYADILKIINENNFKVISIYPNEDPNINIRASFDGGMIDFYKYIYVLNSSKNLTSIDNIEVDNSIRDKQKILLDIGFIKNK